MVTDRGRGVDTPASPGRAPDALTSDPLSLVVGRLPNPKRSGEGYTDRCPAHADRDPSLSVGPGADRAVLLTCFAGCLPAAILRALNFNDDEVRAILAARRDGRSSSATSSYRSQRAGPAGLTVADLARAKGLPEYFLRELGLRDAIGRRAVEIPYHGADGAELLVRTRTSSKTMQPGGVSLTPYGQDRLRTFSGAQRALLLEGESDCWTAWRNGWPALGLPGASSAGCLELAHVEGVQRLYVVQEPDAGGPTFYTGIRKRLTELGWDGEVYAFGLTVNGRRIKDLSDLHLAVGGDRGAFDEALFSSFDTAVLVNLDSDQPIVWDTEDDDPSAWPAPARARIAELEAMVAGGTDGASTCDGNCSTAVILREQCAEYKAADRLLRDGPFSLGTAALVRYLVDQTVVAQANGRDRVPLWRPDVAAAINTNEKTVTRAWAEIEALQEDPTIKAIMPFQLDRRTDEKGKTHVDLVIPFAEEKPSRRQMLMTTVRLPRLKARPGGRQERKLPPSNPDCRDCGEPMTTHRNRQDVCENGTCGRVVTYPTQITRPRLQQAVMMHGDTYATIVQAEDPGDPGQLVPEESGTYAGQVVPGLDAPRRLIPASMVSREDQQAAAKPHLRLLEDDPPRPPERQKGWQCHCGCYQRDPEQPQHGERWRCGGCGARGIELSQMAMAGGSE